MKQANQPQDVKGGKSMSRGKSYQDGKAVRKSDYAGSEVDDKNDSCL